MPSRTRPTRRRKAPPSADQLAKLFDDLNKAYWRGRLPLFVVETARFTDPVCVGECRFSERKIRLDVSCLKDGDWTRSTLLHEMIHLAVGPRQPAHGTKFFAELERLLRKGAPIFVGPGEHEGRPLTIVPMRFRLCREKLRVAYRDADLDHDRLKGTELEEAVVENATFMGENGVPWPATLRAIGSEFATLDLNGRPLRRMRRLIQRAPRAHRKANRAVAR
jgi:hypothetical protein